MDRIRRQTDIRRLDDSGIRRTDRVILTTERFHKLRCRMAGLANLKTPIQPGPLLGWILTGTAWLTVLLVMSGCAFGDESSLTQLSHQFPGRIIPLVKKYCIECHSTTEQKGELDLQRFRTFDDVRRDTRVWQKVLHRLNDYEMPPKQSPQPAPEDRTQLMNWSRELVQTDAQDRAGDPGLVLMRRLTKAEYNYTIHDLTGVDLQPTQKFLEDSLAGEGFANTGEALTMAPDLIPGYIDAARQVAAHAVLTPSGFRFSVSDVPHDWIAETARRIQDLYAVYTDREGRLPITDYLEVTLRYRDRHPASDMSLEDFAEQYRPASGRKLSPKYLRILWDALNESQPVGTMADIARLWRESDTVLVEALDNSETHIKPEYSSDPGTPATFAHAPAPGAFRSPWPYGIPNVTGKSTDEGFIWNPGSHFVIDFGAAKEIDQICIWSGYGGGERGAEMKVSCASRPDGPYTVPDGGVFEYATSAGGGILEDGSQSPDSTGYYQYEFEPTAARYWRVTMVRATRGHMPRTTSIHFGPIPDVSAAELTATISRNQFKLWKFNKQANYMIGSIGLFGSHVLSLDDESGRKTFTTEEHSSFTRLFPMAVCFAQVIPVNRDVTVELFLRDDDALSGLVLNDHEHEQLDRLWDELIYISQEPVELLYNTRQFVGFQPAGRIENTRKFSAMIPSLETEAAEFRESAQRAESKQLNAVIELAARAWRRPLADAEEHRLRQLYESLRGDHELAHDAAIRTVLTRILVSPHFLYRIERPAGGEVAVELSSWELASRLSYFLWSSLPDDQLRMTAAGQSLQNEEALAAAVKRMLNNPRARALSVEFAGQWLQFRGFDRYDGKSESRFPELTTTLKTAMNQEATELMAEIIRNDRSVLEILQADYTFLNEELAAHYGIPDVEGPGFRRVDDVSRFGRGGIITTGSVLTKQSGALRTSPVLRGTWVVETLLGREIPNAPDDVPQLAEDAADKETLTMRERIEQHRADAACAICHTKIDPYGFALEAYDPIGRFRDTDRNGNSIDTRASLQDGTTFEGLPGLQRYLLENRNEFTKQFCRKLLGYALGRTVELSDEQLLVEMQTQLEQNEFRFSAAVLPIVKSRQFRRHRSQNDPLENSP
jgi:hypothetical protein